MTTRAPHLAIALLAATCLSAGAQTIRPGLWEITSRVQDTGGRMAAAQAQVQQQLAALPPDQRKVVEAMMARQGVGMAPGGPAGATTARVCITREMAERNQLPAQQGQCRTEWSPRAGNVVKTRFTCTEPPSSGEGEIQFVSSEAYTMKMTVSTQVQGRPERMTVDAGGRWVGADCGSVRPPQMPR